MSTVGYARVSSVGQSHDVQLDKLKGHELRELGKLTTDDFT